MKRVAFTILSFFLLACGYAQEPTTQVTNLQVTAKTSASISLSWTQGNGTNTMIMCRANGLTASEIPDGNTYNANATYGSGDYIQVSSGFPPTVTYNYMVYDGTGNSVTVIGLNSETEYQFYAVSFNGSGGSEDYLNSYGTNYLTDTTYASGPTTQASSINFSSVGTTSMTINWTDGDGASRLVAVRETDQGTITDPSDGTTYSASTDWTTKGDQLGTSGYYVVYTGSGSSVSLTNLTANTDYWVEIFEFNGSGGTENYYTGVGSGNPANQTTLKTEPATQVTDITFGTITSSSIVVNWSGGDGDSVIVVAKQGSAIVNSPVDGTAYTADAVFNNGQSTIGAGEYVVYNGSRSSGTVTVTGLTGATDYYFRAFTYNNSGTDADYNIAGGSGTNPNNQSTATGEPTTQASTINFSSVGTTSMTINWTDGDGTSRLVAVRETDQGTITDPSDGTTYSASTDWTTKGDQLGTSGYYVVYTGSGSSVSLTNLTANTDYWVEIFEFNGSGGTENYYTGVGSGNPASQTTLKTEPTSQATNIAFSAINTTTMTTSWTRGDAVNNDGVIILAKQGSAVSSFPVDGTSYNADAAFGSGSQIGTGNYVVYSGTATSVDLTALTAGTEYHFRAFEYNNSGTDINYLTSEDTDNPNNSFTLSSEPSQATTITFNNVAATSMDISWTNGNGTGRLVVAKKGGSVSVLPSDQTTYTASTTFGSGDDLGSGNYVVYQGSASSFTLDGLQGDNTYYIRVFEYDDSGVINYNTSSASGNPASQATTVDVAPTTQASEITFSSITTTGMTINWTTGNGSNRIVAVKEGSGSITNPSDNTSYSASSDWLSPGDQLGSSGYYVVYNGSGTSVSITNLTAATEYFVQIFEYNNSVGNEAYQTATASNNPNSQSTLKLAPTTQASDISFSNIKSNSLDVSWSAGDGDNKICIINTSNSFTNPSDGDDPTANAVYSGSGEQVVYNGSSNTVTVSGLSASSTYYFRVYEYNNSGSDSKYITSTASNNPNSGSTLQPANWQGTTSNWETGSNWSIGQAPTADYSVVIQASASTMPDITSSQDLTVDYMTIEAGAYVNISDGGSLTITHDLTLEASSDATEGGMIVIPGTGAGKGTLSVSGSTTIKRYVPTTNQSHLYCSPINAPNVMDFSGYYVGEYDEANSVWSYLNGSSSMSTLKGYEILNAGSASQTLSFTGTLNDDITGTITCTKDGTGADADIGWNLVGNPYPSTINYESSSGWTMTNLDATIYIYDASSQTYSSYTKNDNASFYIAAMQAFFVHVSTGQTSGAFGVTNETRVTNTTTYKSGKNTGQYIELMVSNNRYNSQAKFGFKENATADFDSQFDAYKLLGYNDSIPELYSILNSSTYVQNNFRSTESLYYAPDYEIAYNLGIKIGTSENLTLSLNQINNLENVEIFIYDNELDSLINLKNTNYSFATDNFHDGRLQLKVVPQKIMVESIQVSSDIVNDSIATNTTMQMQAQVLPDNAYNKTVIWEVDDTNIATIDKNTGLLSTKAAGLITVSAVAKDGSGITGTKSIQVYVPEVFVNTIDISNYVDSLPVGSTLDLDAIISPENASNQTLEWKSSDPDIAAIDENSGLVSANSEGTVTITVTSNSNTEVTDSVNIKIYNPVIYVSQIFINDLPDSIFVNQNIQLFANIYPENSTNQTITWTSDNDSIAIINNSNGLLFTKHAGVVNITAAANDGSGVTETVSLEILEQIILVDSMEIILPVDTVFTNQPIQLQANVYPQNANNQTKTWSVNNPELASINEQTGLLSPIKAGNIIVTATANDESDVTANLLIEIVDPLIAVEDIYIENPIDSLAINQSVLLSAVVLPSNASNQTKTWISSNDSIARVSSSGLLTGLATGSVIISVKSNDNQEIIDQLNLVVYQNIVAVNTINIESENDSILINTQMQLSAVVLPYNASDPRINWESANSNIASVNDYGQVTGKSLGNAYIYANALDGSGVSDSIKLFIYNFVSIPNKTEEWVTFYPNPSSDKVIFEAGDKKCNYIIYDNIGNVVLKGSFTKSKKLDISNLQNGLYFIHFETDNKKQVTKLIKD